MRQCTVCRTSEGEIVNSKVQEMKKWFDTLGSADKMAVLQALYGSRLERRGTYVGPPPDMINVNEGLFVGPAPAATSNKCPTCGR